MEYDAVVVGSGPGGASAARELCRAGKRVIMLEYGSDSEWNGNHLSALYKIDLKSALPFGHPMLIRGITTGGSSVIYCGTAARPPAFIKEQTGIDLMPYALEFERELRIAPLPDPLVGKAARRIMDAATAIGIDWQLLPKFIRPDKCVPGCGKCMLGCKREAKWTARDFVKEAQRMGMELRTRVRVEKVMENNGVAVGVRGQGPAGPVEIRAQKVLLAAGGLGSPVILKRSGIIQAGEGFFIDPLLFTYGECDDIDKGSLYDIPMTAGTWQFHEQEGFILTDLVEPWMFLCGSMVTNLPPRIDQIPNLRKMMGIWTKVKDTLSGTIDTRGRITKRIEPEVRRRLQAGDQKAREILLKAGVKKSSLFTSPIKATSPGGSAPIGKVVDTNLETSIENCYVADASVVPGELGALLVLPVLCLGKYAGARMLENWS